MKSCLSKIVQTVRCVREREIKREREREIERERERERKSEKLCVVCCSFLVYFSLQRIIEDARCVCVFRRESRGSRGGMWWGGGDTLASTCEIQCSCCHYK